MDPITQTWLELQCRYTSQVATALVLLGAPGDESYRPMASWPADKPVSPLLLSSAEKLLRRGHKQIFAMTLTQHNASLVACPILAGGQCFGIVAVIVKSRDAELQRQTKQALEWGCAWFAWLARERKTNRERDSRLLNLVEMLALSLKHEDFHQTAQVIADALVKRMACSRACIGMIDVGGGASVAALSGSKPGENVQAIVRPLKTAMEEAADQKATIYCGDGAKDIGLVTYAHQQLMTEHQLVSVCSIPMIHNGEVVAVVTCENLRHGADPSTLQFYEQLALLLGPVLRLKKNASLTRRRSLFGFGKRAKNIAIAAGVLTFLLCFIPGPYDVSTTAVVESDKKQLLVAAVDGFVASAHARAGDRVKSGDLLATLDDKDLKLEQQRWLGKKNQLMKSYNNALGLMDRAEINSVKAQLDQAEAQLALVENQLARTDLSAPFEGVIVAGDLTQSLGAPVKRGDILYEIAPAQHYRLVLKVDERDIAQLTVGQKGSVRLSSMPGESLGFTIGKITPVSTTAEGNNFFHVEAQFDNVDKSKLSPGMSGVAKVNAGKRAYMWIWFHRSIDWLRLWWWRI